MNAPGDLYNPTAEAAEDAKRIPGAQYVVIPSLQGHFAASPAKTADVEFMNKKITEFLNTVTDNGKLLQYIGPMAPAASCRLADIPWLLVFFIDAAISSRSSPAPRRCCLWLHMRSSQGCQ